ncbi:MAG: hypothetical protein FGM26_05345 [Beijerinckiaceae bacterium]|nr:hypothetical protein [Beijerinckiaceae bacterium]
MGPAGEQSETSRCAEAYELALVMFNTFRLDIEKRNLALIDLSEQLFELAFKLQAVSTEDAAERLQRMITLARQAASLDKAA